MVNIRPSALLTRALSFAPVLLLLATNSAFTAEPVTAVRLWPAQDYTRLTLESKTVLRHNLILLKNPDRLALDLEDVELDGLQKTLEGKLHIDDPYIANLRAGRFKPGVVRLVLDLKVEAKPQILTLPPIGEYGHRLVLDIYPLVPIDPLMALLQKNEPKPEPQSEGVPPETPIPGKALQKAAPPPTVSRLITIAIDAGHGGEDPGARGQRGSREKNVTLIIARKLKELVNAEPSMRAFLTRDGDYFIPLDVRVQKAEQIKADLFVSIHADAFVRPNVRGSSVFALSLKGATSKMAKIVAQRENESDLIGGVKLSGKDPYLKMTVADLIYTQQINDSLKLGRAVLGELGGVNDLHTGRVEQAGFAVLKAPQIPSVLVETAFISNPKEEQRLNDPAYQAKIAGAILRGIKSYFAKNPPLSRSTLASNER